jgi:pyruvate dehydrogenase E1 component alpha subunit
MADPEEYRTREQVDQWRARDPLVTFGARLEAEGVLTADEREAIDREAIEKVDAAVLFAENSPFPPPEALYDDVYVLGEQVQGWYSIDERSAGVHRGEDERKWR